MLLLAVHELRLADRPACWLIPPHLCPCSFSAEYLKDIHGADDCEADEDAANVDLYDSFAVPWYPRLTATVPVKRS